MALAGNEGCQHGNRLKIKEDPLPLLKRVGALDSRAMRKPGGGHHTFSILISFVMLTASPADAASKRKSASNRSGAETEASTTASMRVKPLSIPPAGPGAERLDFTETLKRTLARSPDYEVDVQREKVATLEAKNYWSLVLPQLDLSLRHQTGRYGLTNTDQTHPSFPTWNNNLGVVLSENLTETFEGFRTAKVFDFQKDQAKLQQERSRNRVLVDVAKAYYEYSEAVANLELVTSQNAAVVEQFKTIETRYFQGLKSNIDYLRSKADRQRSELKIVTGGFSVNNSRETLKSLVGLSGNYEFIPFDPRLVEPKKITFPEVTPESTLDYRYLQAGIDAAEVRVRSAQYQYWPRLGISLQADYGKPNYLSNWSGNNGDATFNATALVSIDYNLWDWGKRGRDIEIARATRMSEVASLERQRLTLVSQLNTLYANKQTLFTSLGLSTEILQASELSYRNINRAYREGKATYVDQNTALDQLYASRGDDLQLRFNILKTRADLAYLEGKADEVFSLR